MSVKKKTKRETKDGVTLATLNGHPSAKWRVTYTEGGKRKQKYFKKRSGDDGAGWFANDKRSKLKQDGTRHGEVSPDERKAVIEFRELVAELPESIERPSLSEAVALFGHSLKIRHKSKTIKEVADGCLLSLQRRGGGEQHETRTKRHLNRFEDEYGDWLACDLSREILTEWLDDLRVLKTNGDKTKRKMAPRTLSHYRASLTQLFHYAEEIGAISENPMNNLEVPKMKTAEIGILKPIQVGELLTHADDDILPGLLLGFFAGIRRAELGRLDWSEIDFEEKHIEIKAAKAKTASRRIIVMQSNLKAWLEPLKKHTGAVMPSEMVWRTRLAEAMKSAKITDWPHNAARHSFASYHLAEFKNAPALALEMGHSNTKMIFEHYRALVPPKAAKSYWGLTPLSEEKSDEKITNIQYA